MKAEFLAFLKILEFLAIVDQHSRVPTTGQSQGLAALFRWSMALSVPQSLPSLLG